MGIFSRLFKSGQESGSSTEEGDRTNGEHTESMPDETDPPAPAVQPAAATPAKSIWDWPGPTTTPARGVKTVEQPEPATSTRPTEHGMAPIKQDSIPVAKPAEYAATRASSKARAIPAMPRAGTQPQVSPSPAPAPARPNGERPKRPTAPLGTQPAKTKPKDKPVDPNKVSRVIPVPEMDSGRIPKPEMPIAEVQLSPSGRAKVDAVPVAEMHLSPSGRAKTDSIGDVIDNLAQGKDASGAMPAAQPGGAGVSTAEDLEAVRKVFEDVAGVHVAQVRDVMLELRFGEAQPSWVEASKPALRSLRAMAEQMELTDLCGALDAFCAGVDTAIANGRIDKDELLRRYQRLIELIPQAFELDAERDRREPIIVEGLLSQIEGVEKLTIDKLFSVGLNRLDALMNAKADEIAIVAGIREELASRIADRFRAYRDSAHTTVATHDPAVERRELATLLATLKQQNADFDRASSGWTDEAKAAKRDLRKQRDQTFNQIKVALARLGDRDQLPQLEKLPFNERIATLDRYLSSLPKLRNSEERM
jgi:hypothetical protein